MKNVGFMMDVELNKKAKIRAINLDISFADYINGLIRKDLEESKEEKDEKKE